MYMNILCINKFFNLVVIIPLMLAAGFYFSIRLNWIQAKQLGRAFRVLLTKDKQSAGNISHFQAISAVLAGNLGTGNISGMAVALTCGGPGALVWMWVMAFVCAVIKLAGVHLGVKYREENPLHEYVGGPMYYLSKGLGLKKVAAAFAIFAITTAFTVGNLVQVNSLILPLEAEGVPPLLGGIILACLVAAVILGGTMRFARVASTVVPLMALFYLSAAFVVLYRYSDELPLALSTIFYYAFNPTAFTGGAVGFTVLQAVGTGFQRGIFATDTGLGIAPVLQAGARTKSSVVEGLVAMVPPLLVMLVCTVTTLVLLVTGAWEQSGLQSTNMCIWAFRKGLNSNHAGDIVTISLFFFAFTTILAWACCAERAVEFLWGRRAVKLYERIFLIVIPLGAIAKVELVWALADLSIIFMLICNMIGIIGLRHEIIQDVKDYLSQEELKKH